MPNKIIQIITKLELGGAQAIVLDLCRKLISEKNEVVLITNDEGVLVPDAKKIEKLKIYFLPELDRKITPLKDLKCFNKIKNIIKEEKPDIVHTHSSKAGILGRFAARSNKVPVIVHTIHGFAFNDYQGYLTRKLFIILEKLTANFTDRLIAVSYDVMEKGLKENIGVKEQYKVIYNGVDVNLLQNINIDRSIKIKELGLDPNIPIVGMVACLKPQKAPGDFIKMANMILENHQKSQFILAGDGILRDEVEFLVKRYKLEKNVRLLGWRRDLPELLSIMDVFVLTSLWEGLPLTVLEAMAAGKPVVINKIDGNKDIVIDGENGFLCEPKNIKQMAEKVVYLLNDHNKAGSMGEKAKQSVRKYDKSKMLEENIMLYKELL
ncbi:MAG: glycosyltransferase family 4 protein [bacterium]|nr:glycosyltransferase family 4 protein [bacterium]